jgi:ribosomal protein S20
MHEKDEAELRRLAEIGRAYESEQKRAHEAAARESEEAHARDNVRQAVREVAAERAADDDARVAKAVKGALADERRAAVRRFKATLGRAAGAGLMVGAVAMYAVLVKESFEEEG